MVLFKQMPTRAAKKETRLIVDSDPERRLKRSEYDAARVARRFLRLAPLDIIVDSTAWTISNCDRILTPLK